MLRSVINVLTASRLACGLTTFGLADPEAPPCFFFAENGAQLVPNTR
ncbi:hypothetical protein L497_1053 [Bordetella holmesii CDC-H585-BH]|uniref:Uncharacterized protein n=1 Tax=Bordetella holmesii CDC-H585-BH TaxID=1331206 RepID=A0A158M6I1_9BORD|nr:hypothetical protein L497_1053 [Bordetella holmesii CDC-H585-BH]